MSFKAIDWTYQIRDLTAAERVVLNYLAKRANNSAQCFPSVMRISRDCELSRTTVKQTLKKFKRFGVIHKEPRSALSGRSISALITLNYKRKGGVKIWPGEGSISDPGGVKIWPSLLESPSESPNESAIPKGIAIADFSSPLTKYKENSKKAIFGKTASTLLENGSNENVNMKVSDLNAQYQSLPTVEQALATARSATGHYSGGRLAVLWCELRRIHHCAGFQPPLSQKHKGQFAQLAKKFKDGPDVGVNMALILPQWSRFTAYVKGQGLAWDLPDQPSVSFYVGFFEAAVNFVNQKPKLPLGGVKPVVLP